MAGKEKGAYTIIEMPERGSTIIRRNHAGAYVICGA